MTSQLGEEDRGSPKAESLVRSANGRPLDNAGDWNRGLVEHSRDLICIHDLAGRLLSVNPEPARQLGYTVEGLLRVPMQDLVPPEFRPQFDEYLKRIAREREAHGLLTVLARSGSTTTPCAPKV